MPAFDYRAAGDRGELLEGSIDAPSQDAAADLLWGRGLAPFYLRPADTTAVSWWKREVSLGGTGRALALAAFTRQLATLCVAEIPLDDALRMACEQTTSARMRSATERLLAEVLDGVTLSDAMARQGDLFPGDYLSLVRAGEVGGRIGQVLEEIADLLERRVEVRAKIQSALVYPAVLIVLAVGSLGVIIGGLVPSIAPIFAGSGRPMPAGIAQLVTLHGVWLEALGIVAVTVAGIVAVMAMALRRPEMRLRADRLRLCLPLLGALALQQETARFARTLGTLLKAGVPLVQAAGAARDVVANRHMAARIGEAIDAIREGVALHRALAGVAVLPALAVRMISIGEEAGKLDQMLLRLALTFEQQTQQRLERLVTLLTPALTVAIAALVGGLIIAVMNAILSINELAVS